MRILLCLVATALYLSLGVPNSPAQAQAVDAVRKASDDFLNAYGSRRPDRYEFPGVTANPDEAKNNYSALVDQFDDKATYAGTLQPFWLRGKQQIGDLWARYFARYPDRRMIYRDRDIQMFGSSTSVETGYAEMYMGEDPTTSVVTFMRYSITRVLESGTWKIASMMVDRLPSEQPPRGVMPPWANTPARPGAPPRAE